MTMVTPDLKTEAESEALRLAAARALTARMDDDAVAEVESDSPWVAIADGWKRRRRLGRRLFLIWRIPIEDATGATVESHLVGVACELAGGRSLRTKRSLEHALRCLEPQLHNELGVATAEWRRRAESSFRAFTSAHNARLRAVAEREAAATAAREYQPGLFDRRAERTRALPEHGTENRGLDAPEHLGMPAGLRSTLPQLLLVLVP